MHDPERHALSRAAVLLLAVSVVRWVAARPEEPTVPVGAPDQLADHIAATTEAADEQERRGRPLEDGERIDPNSASDVELDRLPGVGPATASAIVSARDSGIVFGRPDDLLVVRGIGPSTLERMRPWLRLSSGAGRDRVRDRVSGGRRSGRGGAPAAPTALGAVGSPAPAPIDVNRAGADELERLPGIGPALAARIVEARTARPFTSLEDLARVRGIGPATVARLRGLAVAGTGSGP